MTGDDTAGGRDAMLYRLLLRLLLLIPVLAWIALSVLGNVDIGETAHLFASAGTAFHHVMTDLYL